MAQYSRLEVYNAIEETRVIPLFFNGNIDVAKQITAACAEGGARVLEFTNRGPAAFEVFKELIAYAAEKHPQLILGIGSIADSATAAIYIQGGANFVVAPFTDPETAKLCNGRKIGYVPGCGTLTEIHNAELLGCEYAKIFPGTQVGGPGFIKAAKAPCPWSKLIPTGGVSPTEESLKSWFDAGVSCVGLGSKLIPSDISKTGDYQSITEKLKFSLSYIKENYS